MRLQELHDLWDRLNQIVENPRLDVSVKQALAGDLINSLPPVMLCGSFELSRVLIEEDMKGRLLELQERYGRSKETSKAEEEVRAEPKHGSKRTRKESI